MNSKDVADYLRQHYSRLDNLLLTLVSCSMLLDKANERDDLPKEVQIVTETLNVLRESLSEEELLTVSMLLAEIERLSDG
jgi:hypothetical protein